MSTDDPVRAAITALTTTLVSIRRGQLDAARGDAPPCDHAISTLWMRHQGLPIVAQCRLATGHDDHHEDEYLRLWTDHGQVTMRERL